MNLLTAQTTTGLGPVVKGLSAPIKFSAQVIGNGAVSATVPVRGRDIISGAWVLLGTITLSGTNTNADAFTSLVAYAEYQAELSAVSGTGAAVTCFVGSA